MNHQELNFYKEKLLKERARLKRLINDIDEDYIEGVRDQLKSELSYYDNHPSDMGDELTELQKGMALKVNEVSLLNKVEKALEYIDTGSYGICQLCKNQIKKERLDILPYSIYCVSCQEDVSKQERADAANMKNGEYTLLNKPFSYGYNDYSFNDEIGYDAEDTYEEVESYDRLRYNKEHSNHNEDFYVEPIEKISNEQYKSQLPD